MDPVYQACDVFVHATLEDVFPIVVLEAMAHGLPVVVSPAPYCLSSNLLSPDEHALILQDPHDAAALAKHIERVQADSELASHLVANAKAFVQRYRWDALAKTQLNMDRELLS
jgi:UDP-glucose:(heptosyl)LPS alpha-1,3-glucosyltransferase